jgi:hypothetical protein
VLNCSLWVVFLYFLFLFVLTKCNSLGKMLPPTCSYWFRIFSYVVYFERSYTYARARALSLSLSLTHTHTHTHTHSILKEVVHTRVCVCVATLLNCAYIYKTRHVYTGCPRRNVPDFGKVFLMAKYTDITQNTYVQS